MAVGMAWLVLKEIEGRAMAYESGQLADRSAAKTLLRKLIGKWGSLGTTLKPQLAALAN